MIIDQLLATLREGFEGPGEQKFAYFLDKAPDAGLRNTFAGLTAEEASRNVGGNSVAAHAHHLLFSFDAFGGFIAGDHRKRDWNESWKVSTVDPESWSKLQSDLEAGYAELTRAIRENAAKNEPAAGGSVGAVAHLAYHIGAIRQKVVLLRA
jgi:hypothetical protein